MDISTRGTRRAVMLLALAACSDGGGGTAGGELTTVATVSSEPNRALDLLLVVDNSAAMAEEQGMLAAGLPQLIDVLDGAPGGRPDLHVGVVSTNVGSLGVPIGGCSSATSPSGDDGRLLDNGCADAGGAFLADLRNSDGSRDRNYSGELATALGCRTRLGVNGCGFEQPLEAMKRALSPSRNPGFLRPAAMLGVLIVTDEDDCSTIDRTMFTDPEATVTSTLGPRTSFRCFEFGVQCANDANPRVFGPRAGCVPRPSSPYMASVQSYVDFVRELKGDPSQVVVGTIAGDVDERRSAVVIASPDNPMAPFLAGSCSTATGIAAPAFRLRAFLEGFPGRSNSSTICDDDLGAALDAFGRVILQARQGDPCVRHTLADVDVTTPGVQPRCEATRYTLVGGNRTDPVVLPACASGAPPCWQLATEPATCATAPSNQALTIDWGGAPPAGTVVEMRCEVVP